MATADWIVRRDEPYTEADLPKLSWAVIRIAGAGDLYVWHKLGYWREVRTGKEVSTTELLKRINAEGWVTRGARGSTWRNHAGYEELTPTREAN